MLHEDHGDGLHQTAFENSHLVPIGQPDYDAIDRACFGIEPEADKVDFSDLVASLSLILQWACGSASNRRDPAAAIVAAGGRVNALLYLLDPVNARFKSLEEIGKASSLSKACISKWLVDLREQVGVVIPMKVSGSTEQYQKAQHFAKARGLHASDVMRRRKEQELVDMDAVAD